MQIRGSRLMRGSSDTTRSKMSSLKKLLRKNSGRSSSGRITVRSQGGRHKRFYREIDFKRDKIGMIGEVIGLEYDPNRNVDIALIKYQDGEFRYILAPKGLVVSDKIIAQEKTETKLGNAMKLKNITIGTLVHNVEITPGRGGQIGRSAGTSLQLLAKEGGFAHLKLPSGEVRMVALESMATVGVLGNEDMKQRVIGKAGMSRHMGIKPNVRGVAQDPDSHPHGGGEGRSGIGRKRPMTKYGRPAVGKTRNRTNRSNRYIVKRRK